MIKRRATYGHLFPPVARSDDHAKFAAGELQIAAAANGSGSIKTTWEV
jgi:hypothetical protein